MIDKVNAKFGTTFLHVTMPAGKLPKQTEPLSVGFVRGFKAAHPEFPEETAYQIVMAVARNAPKMKELHALWKIWSPELMLHGLSEENVHPGAKRAYVELGWWRQGEEVPARHLSSVSEVALAGKVALVTGAARGIGAAIADAFEAEGCAVYRGDILEGTGLALDVTDRDSVRAAMERIARERGGLDILVNNAGLISARARRATAGRGMRPAGGREPDRRLQLHPGRGRPHGGPRRRRDREHRLRFRREGRGRDRKRVVRGDQGRCRRPHARARPRSRIAGHPRERHRAGARSTPP